MWLSLDGDEDLLHVSKVESVFHATNPVGAGKYRAVVRVQYGEDIVTVAAGPEKDNMKKAEAERSLTARQVTNEVDNMKQGKAQTLKLSCCAPARQIPATVPSYLRGFWKKDTIYVALDIVKHPTSGFELICLQKNRANTVDVLDNVKLWAKIKRDEA